MIYFSGDFHINHANIIKYCGRTLFMNKQEVDIYNKLKNRPQEEQKQFKISKESVLKMNKITISRCNERVKVNDILIFLGDLGFKSGTGRGEGEPEKLQKYIDQIKCKNIIWIEGNHDKSGRNGFKTIIRKVIIHYGGKNICLIHDPKFCDTNYDINLVGHVHNEWKIKRYKKNNDFTDCINVGVDQWDFYPITWNQINKAYTSWLKSEILRNV